MTKNLAEMPGRTRNLDCAKERRMLHDMMRSLSANRILDLFTGFHKTLWVMEVETVCSTWFCSHWRERDQV